MSKDTAVKCVNELIRKTKEGTLSWAFAEIPKNEHSYYKGSAFTEKHNCSTYTCQFAGKGIKVTVLDGTPQFVSVVDTLLLARCDEYLKDNYLLNPVTELWKAITGQISCENPESVSLEEFLAELQFPEPFPEKRLLASAAACLAIAEKMFAAVGLSDLPSRQLSYAASFLMDAKVGIAAYQKWHEENQSSLGRG